MGKIPFTITGVDRIAARQFEESFCSAVETVSAWWGGEGYSGRYRVDVHPDHEISRALLPVWDGYRGEVMFPAHRVNEARAAISHEITHVIAPNQNRFLAEGLAVYVQARFGTNPAYPNFGTRLNTAVQPYLGTVSLSTLDLISTPERLEIENVIDGKGAYLIAGSFVQFLIERYGIEKFKALYALTPLRIYKKGFGGRPARWEKVYGKNLPALEREWHAKTRKPPDSRKNRHLRPRV